jgi:biotin-[acetyl-CoA-carboxylase] ligase BirA-like protein
VRGRLAATDGATHALELAGQLELVSRLDDALEPAVVDPRKEGQATSVLLLREDRESARLRKRLDDENARHHGTAREVAGQVPLVRPYALARDHAAARLQFEHLVDKEEGLAVGQNLLDLVAAERRVHGATSVERRMRDSLAREIVVPRLRGRFGRSRYVYAERCPSTQRLVGAADAEGTVAVAEEQTEGRGRLGRSWLAAPGTSVLCSVLLRPAVGPERLPELTPLAAQACAEAIAGVTGLTPELKEPNDLLVGGRKLAGILGEARDGVVVLGIGVNANVPADELPAGTRLPATSLLVETARPVDRVELLVALLERLEHRYNAWGKPGF